MGGKVLAIPHNGNLSNGQKFALQTLSGATLTRDYAERRSRWEPIAEVTQIKGDSETHPLLSPNDEFADYETWDRRGNKETETLEGNYARSALKRGLSQQARLGVNPFKFGMIGSTDMHTALSTADDNNFWSNSPSLYPGSARLDSDVTRLGDKIDISKLSTEQRSRITLARDLSSAGYTGVWATENTREALFDAMMRKEVYASTGPRITVRFFGGWGYGPNDVFLPNFAAIGYNKGVPMGSDLTAAPEGRVPTFLIRAMKDPDGANLDRVQVIKGWGNATGETHEKIYNVALSDGRKKKNNGKVKPVGSSVDIGNASYTNEIGDTELAVVWEDPDFNVDELAFYYVRVLEIPTPRWTAYDAKYFSVKNIPDEVSMLTQERVYSSPIWYTP